jgi:hypothetical protein
MTMVELMVSLAVVMLIIGAATTAYLKLLRTYRTQGRLAESYMANLTGLELLRYDIEMAGFGLPTSTQGASYSEAVTDNSVPYNPAVLNDSANPGPRPFVHLDNTGANNSDVLAIKSSVANLNPASKKWSMITCVQGLNSTVKQWGVAAAPDPVMDFAAADNFIVLNNTGQLQINSSNNWSFSFQTNYYTNANNPQLPTPPDSQQVDYIYGLDNPASNPGGGHVMPFNRVDYYLDNGTPTDIPQSCAGTYTLYRSTISQETGALAKTPLIDCVKDFQVAFGIDPYGDATQSIVWEQTLLNPDGSAMSAADMQLQLREVRVFLLLREGLGDTSTTPDFRFSGYLNLGDQDIAYSLDPADYPSVPNTFVQWSPAALPGALKSFTPANSTDVQYRWKVLEVAVKPVNLTNLQYR